MNFKIEKDFEYEGLRCVVLGLKMGHRCGYVGVPKGHKLYGKDYNDVYDYKIDDEYINVHGGLTYSTSSESDGKYPVESDLWWFGFDCAHYRDGKDFDLIKELATEKEYEHQLKLEREFRLYGTIRTLEYCISECKGLARQLQEVNKA